MPRAAKIPDEQWEVHRSTILSLYKHNTLADVVKTLAEEPYNFPASRAQYPPKLQEWGATKYTKADTWHKIADQVKRRREDGLQSEVFIDGVKVPDRKLKKRTSRIPVSHQDTPLSVSNITLETVEIRDPRLERSEAINNALESISNSSEEDAGAVNNVPEPVSISLDDRALPGAAAKFDASRHLDERTTLPSNRATFVQPMIRSVIHTCLPSVDAAKGLARVVCAQMEALISRNPYCGPDVQLLCGLVDASAHPWLIKSSERDGLEWLQKDENARMKSEVEDAVQGSSLLRRLMLVEQGSLASEKDWTSILEKLINITYQVALANSKLINNHLDSICARALQDWMYTNHVFMVWMEAPRVVRSTRDLFQLAVIVAIERNDLRSFKRLHLASPNLDDPSIHCIPHVIPLQVAVRQPDPIFLSSLLTDERGAKEQDHQLRLLLLDAIYNQRLDAAQILLDRCSTIGSVQSHSRKIVPLVHAIKSGHRSMIHKVLRRSQNVNEVDDELGTALSQAAKHTDMALVRTLLLGNLTLNWPFTPAKEYNLEKNFLLDICATYERGANLELVSSALQNAVLAKNLQIVEALIGAGASLSPKPLNLPYEKDSNLRKDICLQFSRTSQWPLLTPLQAAVTVGDQDLVLRCLQEGASVDGRAFVDIDETPLQIAVRLNNLELATILVEYHANIVASPGQHHKCRTALQYAIENGNKDIFRLLLEKERNLDDESMTRVRLAQFGACIASDRVEMLMMLLERGVAIPREVSLYQDLSKLTISHLSSSTKYKLFDHLVPGAQDVTLWNFSELMQPLILMAGQAGTVEIIEKLLRYSLSIGCFEIKITAKYAKDDDAISQQLKLYSLMVDHGWATGFDIVSDLRKTRGSDFSIALTLQSNATLIFQSGTLLFRQDISKDIQQIVYTVLIRTQGSRRIHSLYQRLALREAIQHGTLDLVQQLLSSDFDGNRWLWNHGEILELAAETYKSTAQKTPGSRNTGPKESGGLILSAIISKNIPLQAGRALQYASQSGHWQMVDTLLSHGVDPNEQGKTFTLQRLTMSPAFCEAIKQDRLDMAVKLLDAGADLAPWVFEEASGLPTNSDRRLPIELAAEKGNMVLVEKILGFGIPVEMRADEYLQGAVRAVAQTGNTEIAERLLRAGAEFDSRALDLAAENGRFDIVSLFLQNTRHSLPWWILDSAVKAANKHGFRNIARYIERKEWSIG